jgi:tripartite-type tricarboxylate transporter receptor subunit TctC
MKILTLGLCAVAGLAVAVSATGTPAQAEGFYEGKNLRVIHGGGARGSYAIYTRIFAQHFAKHLPGKPTPVAEFMSGAGGLKADNYAYNAAPKDGTVLLMPTPGIATANILFDKSKARFDARKFNWIGHITRLQSAIGVWKDGPATTIEQARKVQITLGSTGKSSELTLVPQLMNSLIGTKFKIITGYKGIGAVSMAMETGELHGRGGGMTAWHMLKKDWFQPKERIVFLAQLGLSRHPWIPNVPLVQEFASNDSDRQVIELAAHGTILSRAVAAPPGVEAARVKELRDAFLATMKDPEYLGIMKKRNLLMIEPMTWQEVDAFLAKTMATPEPIKKRFRDLMGVKG